MTRIASLLPCLLWACTGRAAKIWNQAIHETTTTGNMGMQIDWCRNPPPEAPDEGKRHCASVVAPSVLDLVKQEVDTRAPPFNDSACRTSLRALAFADRTPASWRPTRDRIVARCCTSEYSPPEQCRLVGVDVAKALPLR